LGGDLNTIHAYLAAEQVDEVAGGRRVELVAGFGLNDPMIEQLLLAMDGVLKEQAPNARTYVDHLTAMLAAHLVYRYHATAGTVPRTLGGAGLDQRQLDDVIDVMNLRLAEPIPLADLAAVAGLSTSQLIRRFKTSTGLAPHRYLVRLRLAHAVRGLRTGDRPIADIAQSCGFSHQEHLTRAMRRQMGTTPAQVRRSC
jgi:AraC family transcriptional regulator